MWVFRARMNHQLFQIEKTREQASLVLVEDARTPGVSGF